MPQHISVMYYVTMKYTIVNFVIVIYKIRYFIMSTQETLIVHPKETLEPSAKTFKRKIHMGIDAVSNN